MSYAEIARVGGSQKVPAANAQHQTAIVEESGTPRNKQLNESVQLGGQAAVHSKPNGMATSQSEGVNDEDKQLLLVKFIQHSQHAEFIEVYKMFQERNSAGFVEDSYDSLGKSFLHLAVEYGAAEIVEFLLNEAQTDPNMLTHNTQMSALHLAVIRGLPSLIELLLMHESTNVNQSSELHGTPLHTACKSGSLKIVQQLLLNSANMQAQTKDGLEPRDLAADQRVLALIDRYEKRFQNPVGETDFTADLTFEGAAPEEAQSRGQVLEQIVEEVNEMYGEESEEEAYEGSSSSLESRPMHRRSSSQAQLTRPRKSILTSSSGAASPMMIAAVQYIKEFEQSRVEIVPIVMGELYSLHLLPKKRPGKPSLRFAVLDPILGDLKVFKTASDFRNQKLKQAKTYFLNKVVCAWGPSGRIEMRKHEIEVAIELNFYDESILLLGAHEKDQVNQWLASVQKAQKFVQWLESVRAIVQSQIQGKQKKGQECPQAEALSDQLVFKLQQMLDFCESSARSDKRMIEHFTPQEAKLLAKQRLEAQVLEQARQRVRAETQGGEVSYVRKSQLAQQKQQSRHKELLEMKFSDDAAGDQEQGSTHQYQQPAGGRQEASQERAQAESQSNLLDDGNEMSFDKSPLAENLTQVVKKQAKITEEAKQEEIKEVTSVTLPHRSLRFDDFEILGTLGEGSFGKVFKVRRKESGKVYAMKSMSKKQLIQNHQVKYAVTEAQIMKKLDHSYVLKLMYTFQTPEYMHMVMELCEHGDLSKQLDHHQYFEENLARFIAAELILAMEHVHNKGVLYRDLKPENIMIDADGHIRLGDFGLAKQAGEEDDDSAQGKNRMVAQSFCGSPAYLAPEMLNKAGVSASGDVYQIGVVLYEMLVGIPPFYNDNINILYKNISQGKLKIPNYLSKGSKNILTRMLNRDPKKRPSIEQVKSDAFFAGINWEYLAQKMYRPPQKLGKLASKSGEGEDQSSVEADMFQDGISSPQKQRSQGLFSDQDYTELNQNYNRVRDYSFHRVEPLKNKRAGSANQAARSAPKQMKSQGATKRASK